MHKMYPESHDVNVVALRVAPLSINEMTNFSLDCKNSVIILNKIDLAAKAVTMGVQYWAFRRSMVGIAHTATHPSRVTRGPVD